MASLNSDKCTSNHPSSKQTDVKHSRTNAHSSRTQEDSEDRQHLKPVEDWLKELRDPQQLITALDNQVTSSSDRFNSLVNRARSELASHEASLQAKLRNDDFKDDLGAEFKPAKDDFHKGVHEIDEWFSSSVADMESKVKKRDGHMTRLMHQFGRRINNFPYLVYPVYHCRI